MPKLRPRARIVRTIGDQLISGPEAAIIELVKNAFDADSPFVQIVIEPRRGSEPGKIVVSDRGHGMSRVDILGKWFEPATSDKVERKISPKNRVMLGAKGVGRFATARLGNRLHLTSKTKLRTGAIEITDFQVDWTAFEKVRYLDQVELDIKSRRSGSKEHSGVVLEITELRDHWSQQQLVSLVRELRRMISPVGIRGDDFRIYLDLSAFTTSEAGFDGAMLVAGSSENHDEDPARILPLPVAETFHYQVRGRFDKSGGFKGAFVNRRGDAKSQSLVLQPPPMNADQERCGAVTITLNIYDREGDAIQQLFAEAGLQGIGRIDAKRILDENIGIGIYRGSFRIRPYGDAETDWLELERMRVQNPSRKLGLNQVWGIVGIEDEAASGLIERSSREGLEHNGAFERLKAIVADLLTHVEALRQDFREHAGISRRLGSDPQVVRKSAQLLATNKAVSSLPKPYRDRIEKALRKDSADLKTSIAELETYHQVLASHSALGLVVSQVLHDGRRFLSDIVTRSKRLSEGSPRLKEESAFGRLFREKFPEDASSIYSSGMNLTRLFRALDPISGRRRGRPGDVKVLGVVQRALGLFGDAIADLGISVDLDGMDETIVAVVYEADLLAAVLNILDNAIHWLSSNLKGNRRITISCRSTRKYVRLLLANNGPSIDLRYVERLFSPGFSLKTEGSGIGLAIAREAMRASKGDVAFDSESEQTTFVIEMRAAGKDY